MSLNRYILFIILYFILNSSLFAEESISKNAYNQLQIANKMIKEEKYQEAKSILNEILKSKNKMERTYALQEVSNIAIYQNDYKSVIKYYKELITLKTLKKDDLNSIKFSLSEIYLSEEMYKESIKLSLFLLNSSSKNPEFLYKNLAIAYYYNQEYKKSIPYTKKLINIEPEKEQWQRVLYSSYIEIKDYNNAIKILKYMVAKYSKEEYWMQLIFLYQTTNQNQKLFGTLELAYKNLYIKQEENLLYFVTVLMQQKIYNKAGEYLKRGFDKKIVKNTKENFDILVSCYANAKNYEELISLLENSKYGKSEKYKILIANIYFNNGNYKKVLKTLENFEFEKNSKYDGKKYIMLSLSAYELEENEISKEYLKKALLNKFERKRALLIAQNLGFKI